MIYVGKYNELNPGKGYPSMRDSFSATSYPGKDAIIQYLTHGNKDMVSAKIPRDVFTNDVIPMDMVGMNDGEYTWFVTLAYYVDKYNLRLPREFEDKILNRSKDTLTA